MDRLGVWVRATTHVDRNVYWNWHKIVSATSLNESNRQRNKRQFNWKNSSSTVAMTMMSHELFSDVRCLFLAYHGKCKLDSIDSVRLDVILFLFFFLRHRHCYRLLPRREEKKNSDDLLVFNKTKYTKQANQSAQLKILRTCCSRLSLRKRLEHKKSNRNNRQTMNAFYFALFSFDYIANRDVNGKLNERNDWRTNRDRIENDEKK